MICGLFISSVLVLLMDHDANFVYSRPIAKGRLKVLYDSMWPLTKTLPISETIAEHQTLRIAKWDFCMCSLLSSVDF